MATTQIEYNYDIAASNSTNNGAREPRRIPGELWEPHRKQPSTSAFSRVERFLVAQWVPGRTFMTRRRVDNTAASVFHTGSWRRSSAVARAERRKHRARIKPYQHRSILKCMYSHIVCVARGSRDARPQSARPVRQHHERRLRLILRDVDSVSKGHCLWHAPHGRHVGAHCSACSETRRGTSDPEGRSQMYRVLQGTRRREMGRRAWS